jgi:hypothetical protein
MGVIRRKSKDLKPQRRKDAENLEFFGDLGSLGFCV